MFITVFPNQEKKRSYAMFDGHSVCTVTCGLGTRDVVSLVHEEQASMCRG